MLNVYLRLINNENDKKQCHHPKVQKSDKFSALG